MYKYCLFIVIAVLFCLAIRSARAQSGDVGVGANVTQPAGPTSTTTPTQSPSSAPTSAPTTTVSPSPVPSGATTQPSGPTTSPFPSEAPQEPIQIYYLDISGFSSPFASIVMYANSKFVRATTADRDGNFSLLDVAVVENFTEFCLEQADFKRLGTSYTCFDIPPVTSNRVLSDIFLPPTIGLSARTIGPGGTVSVFGYTMPSASTTVHISKDINLKITADSQGYYKDEIKDLPVGTYQLFATANYQSKESEIPDRTVGLTSLSAIGKVREDIKEGAKDILTWILEFLKQFGWLAIPIIILIFILLSKRVRDSIADAARERRAVSKAGKVRGHHGWFIGE